MSYGIEVKGSDGTVNLHSEYSSLVYVGKQVTAARTARVWVTGTGFNAYDDAHFDIGYSSVFYWYPPTALNTVVPFYKPAFDGQKVAVSNVFKRIDGSWEVNITHDGLVSQVPEMYFFASMTELQPTITDTYGLNVYNSNSALVFSTQYIPLKLDGTYVVNAPYSIARHSSSIKPTSYNRTSTHYIESDTLYSFVSLSYGVLAYNKKRDWKDKKKECYRNMFVTVCWNEYRPCSSFEARWGGFASTVMKSSSNSIDVGYIGEFGGWYYNKSCGSWKKDWGIFSFVGEWLDDVQAWVSILLTGDDGVHNMNLKYYDTPELPTNNFNTTLMMTRSSYYE